MATWPRQTRQLNAQFAAKIASPAAADLIGMLEKRNPKSNRSDLIEVEGIALKVR